MSFQNSYIEILPLDMMVFGSGAIDSVYEGRARRNEISVLIKIVIPESSLLSLPCEETMRKCLSATQKRVLLRTPHYAGTLSRTFGLQNI